MYVVGNFDFSKAEHEQAMKIYNAFTKIQNKNSGDMFCAKNLKKIGIGAYNEKNKFR